MNTRIAGLRQKSIIMLVGVMLPFACSKSEDAKPDAYQYLVAKSWHTNRYTFEPTYPNASSFDIGLDDVVSFYDDGTFIYDNGSNRAAGDPQLESGVWSLSTDKTTLTFTPDGQSPRIRTLVTVDQTTLQYFSNFTDNGVSYKVTKTHQAIDKVVKPSGLKCTFLFGGSSITLNPAQCDENNGQKYLVATNDAGTTSLGLFSGPNTYISYIGDINDGTTSYLSGIVGTATVTVSGKTWTFSGTVANGALTSKTISGTCTCSN